MVASHLDNKSLIVATHVCRAWRTAFIDSHILWSHLTPMNDGHALAFLERSNPKPVPISVDFSEYSAPSKEVKGLLKKVTDRLTGLRDTTENRLLDDLLTQPLPILKNLDFVTGCMPNIVSSAPTNLYHLPRFPRLTNLRFQPCIASPIPPMFGDALLGFLRECPLLEVAFFEYGNQSDDIEFTAGAESGEAVSLPRLRSFTHEAPTNRIYIGLFNRLSLPPTCNITFAITDYTSEDINSWNDGFPTLCGSSYLPDVKKVEVAVRIRNDGFTEVRTRFSNSENRSISLTRLTITDCDSISVREVKMILDFLASCEMVLSVEILHLERCPLSLSWKPPSHPDPDLAEPLQKLRCLKTLVFWECNPKYFLETPPSPAVWCPSVEKLVVFLPQMSYPALLERVQDIAKSREWNGNALKTVSLAFQGEKARSMGLFRESITAMSHYVKEVEVI